MQLAVARFMACPPGVELGKICESTPALEVSNGETIIPGVRGGIDGYPYPVCDLEEAMSGKVRRRLK